LPGKRNCAFSAIGPESPADLTYSTSRWADSEPSSEWMKHYLGRRIDSWGKEIVGQRRARSGTYTSFKMNNAGKLVLLKGE
jgi:hypothetical protein